MITTLACAAIAVAFGDPARYLEVLRLIDLRSLAAVCLVVLGCNLCRIWRLRFVVGSLDMRATAEAVFVHQLAAQTIPAKLGEAVLPLLLVRSARLGVAEAVGVLLLLRVLDLLTLLVVSSIVIVLGTSLPPYLGTLALGVGALALLATVLLVPLSRWLLSALRMSAGKWVTQVANALKPAAVLRATPYLGAAVASVALWTLNLLAFALALRELVEGVPWDQVALAAAAGNVVSALPVQGFAGLGPAQLSWAGVLQWCGHDFEVGVISGVVVQLCGLVAAAAGSLAMIVYGRFPGG